MVGKTESSNQNNLELSKPLAQERRDYSN